MDHYWTQGDRERLQTASSLQDLVDVAYAILERIKSAGQQAVLVCGPLTTGGLGNREANFARFAKAIRKACEHGLAVFDQLPFEEVIDRLNREGRGDFQKELHEGFYRPIIESRRVKKALFLSDWPSSTGASRERGTCHESFVEVVEYPMEWLDEE